MYLSLIERKLKTSPPIFKILTSLNQDFSSLNFDIYFLFLALFWPTYLTFKFDFCLKNRQRSFKSRYLEW